MRKVLHVSHSLDTGGGPHYIKKIIQDLPEIDHYVCGNIGYYYFLFQTLIGEEKTKLLRGKNLFHNILVLRKMCKDKSITTVHCHGRGAALYTRLLKVVLPKIRVVYTIHGFHPDTLNQFMKPYYIFSERILLYLTNAVIAVSRSERERFIRNVKPAKTENIFYIPNYIADSDMKPQPFPLTLDAGCINFLYIGRLSPEKGIDILLEAWRNVENKKCRLYIIGYGPMETLVRSSLDNLSITYLGKIENASSMMSHFDAIIIPSRFEGMPYVGLEAMISKTIVIVTPAVGITDLFTPDTSYMAADFSGESLREAILSFVRDFDYHLRKIEDKVELNYERQKKEFSKENISKILEIYNSC